MDRYDEMVSAGSVAVVELPHKAVEAIRNLVFHHNVWARQQLAHITMAEDTCPDRVTVDEQLLGLSALGLSLCAFRPLFPPHVLPTPP